MQILLNNIDSVKKLAVLADESRLHVLVSDGRITAEATDILAMMRLDLMHPVSLTYDGTDSRLEEFISLRGVA